MTDHTHQYAPPPGTKTEVLEPVEAKQATNKPRNMPMVLSLSLAGAVIALGVIWMLFLK
ncbi:hypothetical protein GCM10008171_16870 [Methylopila jiangsuensis]|uniref:Uncharacterized protein n=1 Tax=Methylopila jiangsuensis TaxID=586230 RepID=A0A9W6JJ13_9HYPH|nr:hypothetical protein [Methylopila jiangsuensis]MDR6284054.1 hypothetical protein [Methylopila jiangsuensis]GLK76433.1 hypothetical protein GCM10008171_16870 [Methylopila jiangsuensis]